MCYFYSLLGSLWCCHFEGRRGDSLGAVIALWVDMHQSSIFAHSIPAVAEDSTSAVGYLPLELQSNEQDLRRE